MEKTAPRGTLGTVHNAALLLELLGHGPAYHHLTDLAERSGLSLPTLHRLLRSLVAAGLVEQDARTARYGLGVGLVRLSDRYLSRLPVLAAAGPYLVELRDRTRGTVRLSTLVGVDTVELDRVDGDEVAGVFRDVSRLRPALGSAAGRLLLAHADDTLWCAALDDSRDGGERSDGHQLLPGHHPTNGVPLVAEVTDADRRRWRDADHLILRAATPADHTEVAATVRCDGATPLVAIAVSGPGHRFGDEHLEAVVVPELVRATTALARSLSHE
jgi:IclR family transcriptional regulator, acetate operon repressor